MDSDISALLWLQRRHLRSELNFYLWAAGADLDEQRDLTERLYLLYIVIILAAAAGACWMWIIGLVEDAAAHIGQAPGMLTANAPFYLLATNAVLVLAPITCGVVWSVRAAWTPRLQLSAPDRAVLAQLPVRPEIWTLTSMVPQHVATGIVGALVGYLAADAAVLSGGGTPVLSNCLFYALTLGFALIAARAASWLVSIIRLRCGRARRAALALAVAVVGAVAMALGLMSTAFVLAPFLLAAGQRILAIGSWVPLAVECIAAGALIVATVALSRGLAARSLTVEAAADADLYAVRRMALYNPQLYRDVLRRSRAARRRPFAHMPHWHGTGAPFARALVSTLRRYDTLPRVLAAGALLAPCGVFLLSGDSLAAAAQAAQLPGGATGGRILGAASWVLIALRCSSVPRDLARVYRDDAANRLVRPHLPFPPFALFMLDSVPALLVAGAASCAVGLIIGPPAMPWLPVCALALDVVLACCGALDTVEADHNKLRVSCEAGLVIAAVALAVLSAIAPAPLLPVTFWAVALGYLALSASSL